MAKILQIGMVPHNLPLFKFICAMYQFHHQTLPIMKIDQAKSKFDSMFQQKRLINCSNTKRGTSNYVYMYMC